MANLFADKYQDLYTSVPYGVNDITVLCDELHKSTTVDGFDGNCMVNVAEVIDAVHKLKPSKSDGCIGLSSDFFIHACDELFVYISLLFTGLLVHGCIPEIMSLSTVCLLYTSPSPRDRQKSRMPSSA